MLQYCTVLATANKERSCDRSLRAAIIELTVNLVGIIGTMEGTSDLQPVEGIPKDPIVDFQIELMYLIMVSPLNDSGFPIPFYDAPVFDVR